MLSDSSRCYLLPSLNSRGILGSNLLGIRISLVSLVGLFGWVRSILHTAHCHCVYLELVRNIQFKIFSKKIEDNGTALLLLLWVIREAKIIGSPSATWEIAVQLNTLLIDKEFYPLQTVS